MKKDSKKEKAVSKSVEQINRAPLKQSKETDAKPRKPAQPPSDVQQWLSAYIKDTSKSGAKLTASLFARPEGCTIEEASRQALELAKTKGSKWGNESHIRSHISFMRTKGVQFSEKDGIYKIIL